jgi:rRNA maturation protein Nop10
VTLADEPVRTDVLRSLGISFIGPENPLVKNMWFDIDESHRGWPTLQPLISQWNAVDIAHTEFSASERATAKYFQMSPAWHCGYPQPDGDFGYLGATYDLKAYCPSCGIGKTQAAPFRIKGEPKWGKKHVLQLNWVFDEYFVRPATWEQAFRPLGVGCSPVLDHRTGHELQTIVQLDIKLTANSGLSMGDNHPSEICGSCGRKKYLPISRGFFPALTMDPAIHMCRTQEYFGSGASAWHAIVVSSRLYDTVQSHKLSGVTFVPLCAL